MEKRFDDGGQDLVIIGIIGKEGSYNLHIDPNVDGLEWGLMVVRLLEKGANGYFRRGENEVDLGGGMILRRDS